MKPFLTSQCQHQVFDPTKGLPPAYTVISSAGMSASSFLTIFWSHGREMPRFSFCRSYTFPSSFFSKAWRLGFFCKILEVNLFSRASRRVFTPKSKEACSNPACWVYFSPFLSQREMFPTGTPKSADTVS